MKTLRFGTAGTPISSPSRDSISGVKRIHELGLRCMEVEFVRGVKMGTETAEKVGQAAIMNDIALSVHAPYYINLNSRELDKVDASRTRILDSARIGALFGARSVVFHPAYYHDDPSETVYGIVKTHLMEMAAHLEDEGTDILLRPETTGKGSQFGTLIELLEMGAELEGVVPCYDFSHMHAREGTLNSYEEFCGILETVEDYLGKEGLDNMHIHVSGIEYGPKGEKNHLILEESDMDYHGLIRAWKEYGIKGTVICESPNLEGDALLLQGVYGGL
ncbi:MAG: TIM barrel protein [Methanosarcinales archaeon]|nr:TIM barrel protein [ANME-2 cluster archaeon]MDF1531566.1 TIM barrel protein [ANME-2 cluster archaeon]MDW7776322.1 TIM barrel protein [Methanosarcinales archaeon]